MTRTSTMRRSFPTLCRLTTTLRRSFPTLRWMMIAPFRWLGRNRQRIWGAAAVLLAMIAAPPLWWTIQLVGLPDIGDPFDVAAFRALSIPDDQNAVVLYRQAAARLKPLGPLPKTTAGRIDRLAPWSRAHPDVRRWVEEDREALALFRRGAERPDSLDRDPEFQQRYIDSWDLHHPLSSLHGMALLEGSRLQEQGDMAGAWGWYRTILRSIWQVGRHGTVQRRRVAQTWHDELRERLAWWAADSRTTPELLRHALDDAVACEALAPSESYTLKAEYLLVERRFDDPKGGARLVPPAWMMSLAFRKSVMPLVASLSREQVRSIVQAWEFWRREPERSRRILRLAVANWLAYYDLPPEDRPKPDPEASLAAGLYPFGPSAPAQARALSPPAFDRWVASSNAASFLLQFWGWQGVRWKERANHKELLILLGTELYRREHGTDPPTPEALVGPYLKSLPPDDPDDDRGETIPRSGGTIKSKPIPESPKNPRRQIKTRGAGGTDGRATIE